MERKLSIIHFIILGWWLGPVAMISYAPIMIPLARGLRMMGFSVSANDLTAWCWGRKVVKK